MGVQHKNTTNYQHPNEPNLLDLHNVMQYNDTGEPVLRTHVDGITLEGNVIVDKVRVEVDTLHNTIDATHPVPVYFPSTPSVNISDNGSSITVDGTVSLSQDTLTALETITVNQGTGGNSAWKVDIGTNGTVTINQPVAVTQHENSTPWQISKNSTINSNTNPIFVKGTSDTSFFSPTQSDAFGRLRVSNPFTLQDHFNRYQDNEGSFNYTTGAGSAGYDANNAAVTLTVGTSASDSVIRETAEVYAYQPGKSLLILQTFTFAPWKTNLTQRAGYFDTANGFYVERAGNTVYFVKRSSSSGVMTETRVPQTGVDGWNVNQLPSLNLDFSQIFWMDVEWLGVGSVRMGFVIDGEFIHCHTWHHANNITGVYMSTSCLPVRKEIFNTGTTTGSSTMLSICTSVISEGGYSITGRDLCVGHTLGVPVTLSNTPSVFTPLISVRLKNTRLGAIVLPTTFTVTPVQQAVYKYQIYTRAITTGGTWISAGSNSSVEYNLNPTSILSGSVSLSAFINSTNQSSGSAETVQFPFQYQLERNSFVPTCYEVVIGIGASTNNCTAYGSINWTEIT